MKQANKTGARHVLIIGDDELTQNKGVLRNMATQEQKDIGLESDVIKEAVKPSAFVDVAL